MFEEAISEFPRASVSKRVRCSAFDMETGFHSMQLKLIFTRKVVNLASFSSFFFFIIGAVGVVTGEDTLCTDHSRQQNDRSNSGSNTERTTPLSNGYKYHINLRENCRYENSERYEDDDELDKDKNHGYCHGSKAADGNGTYASASCSFVKCNGNGDDDVYDDNEDESEDGNYVTNCNNRKDAECYTGGANELDGRHGDFDVDCNSDEDDDEDDDDDHDGGDGDKKDGGTVENAGDRNEEGDKGHDNPHHPHYHYALDNRHSGGGGGEGNINSSDERAGDKDDGTGGKYFRKNNFGYEIENDDADDHNYIVTKSISLPVDRNVPGKSIQDTKLDTKETNFSLPVNSGLDDQVISQTIIITAGDNSGNEKLPGARAKTLLTSNEYTAKVPTTSYAPSLKQKTSSPRLPRGNWAELDYLYKSRIPSLEATGVNQKFLERHTTDLSLQNVSQPGDFNLQKNSTPLAEWPMWSLPPPDASETGHRWRHSSGLQPSVVGNQTGGQSNWQFWNQPSREMNSSNFNPQEQKSFNRIDPWFASGAEAFTGLRISDSLPATNGTISGSLFNTHAAMASADEPKWRYSANNSYWSHLNSPTYRGLPVRDGPPVSRLPTVKSHSPVVCPSVTTPVTELQPTASVTSQSVPSYSHQSNVLPENLRERFMEHSIPNSFTVNQEPIISSASRIEEQRAGTDESSLEFPDDPSLAALERKVAEACAVVERVMKEREERTKAQREAARKKREMREQREREAREMREREERERREREERKRKEREEREREDRKMRERREREIREREERDRSEEIENEDRDTRWFGGERAPVQESPRWQCEHYQRRCLVKFPCCGIFYPCHRCHNTSGACDTDDRKANNATHVKCGVCGHEEEVSVCHN